MRIGTSNFVSFDAAVRYYAKQDIDQAGVDQKLWAAEISIGRPDFNDGCEHLIVDEDGRYIIVDNDNPGRLKHFNEIEPVHQRTNTHRRTR